MIPDKYLMEGGVKYNIGRILIDAGIKKPYAAVVAQVKSGEIAVAPEVLAMVIAAEQHNAEVDARRAAADAQRLEFRPTPDRSEWMDRDGRPE